MGKQKKRETVDSLRAKIRECLDRIAIERDKWDLANIFGTEGMLLGKDGKGAYALSKDKSNNLLNMIDSVSLDLGGGVTKDLIETGFRLNGWPGQRNLNAEQPKWRPWHKWVKP